MLNINFAKLYVLRGDLPQKMREVFFMHCVDCPICEECLCGWIATKEGTFDCEDVIRFAEEEVSRDEDDN